MKRSLFAFLLIFLFGNFASFKSNAQINSTVENAFALAYQNHPNLPVGILEAVSWTETGFSNIDKNTQPSCIGIPLPYGVMGLFENGDDYFIENAFLVEELSGISIASQRDNINLQVEAYASAFEQIYMSQTDPLEERRIYFTLRDLSNIPELDRVNIYARDSQIYSVLFVLTNQEYAEKFNFTPHSYNLVEVFGEENYAVLSSTKVVFEEDGIKTEQGLEYLPLATALKSTDYGPAIWDPAATCNYGTSRNGYAISAVTIHTIQGSYAGCISWFKNCNASVSAHYVIRKTDGQVTQMVRDIHRAWHVGNSNNIAIGIEHDGYVTNPEDYTTFTYQSSANLVRHFTTTHAISPLRIAFFPWSATTNYSSSNIPGSCVQIKGHQHFPAQTHTDPGQHWNWDHFYKLINNTTTATTYTATSGTVYDSGGASGNYGNDERKIWVIKPNGASTVTLNFTAFNLENTWDYLYIYNGDNVFAPKIGHYTGTTSPGTITSTGNALTLEFRSDCATATAGFAANWTSQLPTPPDDVAPTTAITLDNSWKTENFEVNFTDADNSGGSGVSKSLYTVQSFDGTNWVSNRDHGFLTDEFETNTIGTNWTSQIGTWVVNNGVLAQTDESVDISNIHIPIKQDLSNMHIYHWKGKISGSGTNRRAGIHFFRTDPATYNGGDSYLVYFRTSGNPDANNNNKVQLYKSTGDVLSSPIVNESYTINPDVWYDFKVGYDRITGKIYVWVNNNLVIHWTDPQPITNPTGYISFRNGNSVYEVDELNVYRSRYPDVNITVGVGTATDVFHQNPSPTTPAGKVKSIIFDNAGNISTIDTKTFNVDWSAPVISYVNDGTGTDINTTDSENLEANWSAAVDAHSGIDEYKVSIGTEVFGTDIMDWTAIANGVDSYSFILPDPIDGQIYYYNVWAKNGAGLETISSSNGVVYLLEEEDNGGGDISALENEELFELILYPNPTNHSFSLQNLETDAIVKVYDMVGQLVWSQTVRPNENEINISKLAQGMYNVVVEIQGGQIERILIKE